MGYNPWGRKESALTEVTEHRGMDQGRLWRWSAKLKAQVSIWDRESERAETLACELEPWHVGQGGERQHVEQLAS